MVAKILVLDGPDASMLGVRPSRILKARGAVSFLIVNATAWRAARAS